MRRLATVTLSLLLSVAALYSSVAPAAACSCAPVTETEQVRDVMEYYGLVVEGVIAPDQRVVATEHIRFQPEILYEGDVSGEIALDQTWEHALSYPGSGYSEFSSDCRYFLLGDPGDRYVLFLRATESGMYSSPAGCASFALGEIEASFWPDGMLQQRYDAIKLISDGGTVVEEAPPQDVPVSPEDSGGDGPAAQPGEAPPKDEPAEPGASTPWAVILPIAFAIPLAVLVVPALIRRRTGH